MPPASLAASPEAHQDRLTLGGAVQEGAPTPVRCFFAKETGKSHLNAQPYL